MIFKVLAAAYLIWGLRKYRSVRDIPTNDPVYPKRIEGKFIDLNGKIAYQVPKEVTKCMIDTNHILRNFVVYIILPCFIFRFYVLYKYKDADDVEEYDYRRDYGYVQNFWNACYGMWTILNLIKYLKLPNHCKQLSAPSMINYEIFILMGLWSAVNVIFWALILLVAVPFLCYMMYKKYKERTAHLRRAAELKNSLVKKPFDKAIFTSPQECPICMCEW